MAGSKSSASRSSGWLPGGVTTSMRAYSGVLASSPQPLASAIAAIAFKALFPSSTSSPVGATGRMSSVYLPPR